ncbi:DUF2845 domain-containing protein [Rhodanobacter sp. T12-5]|uniref:DUF2845 domain-containing protein n=1 Tax=Rhodanobacter sp. T12-5 TaxID=2024611 RepID=UPI0011EC7B23|nr:DUF2845 domain-containing protein [Rhodanobacter sp. T12-5]KAA0069324.1 DUF2845 domain-containing protein [Rhodanobacter sp. T12-5]
MRVHFIVALFAFSAAVHASSTLRVGNRVLTAGDSRERVVALLGKPTSKSHAHKSRRRGGRRGVRVLDNHQGGEQWRYRRGDHVTVVTIVGGRVSDIEDRRL